ncbi:MAG: peptidoglycan DD-metalloendopeptidase family protein [Patescibacteria group bacterium]|nr:peptidoglycan DD-metalloendopeptidase family protein [Patescibacteria group bacterium]
MNSTKSDKQKQLDQINQQIKQFQQQIATAQKSTNTLKNEIYIYDKQIASTQLSIEAKQTQIDDTNLQIQQLQILIDQKQNDLNQNRQILSELIVQLNDFDNQYGLKTTIGSDSLSDFFDKIQQTQDYQGKIYQLVQKIKDVKQQLQQDQDSLKVQVANLTELKNQLQITQDSLSEQRSQKQQLLNQTRGLESNYQKLLAAGQKEQDDLQKEIQNLDAQIRAKLGYKTVPAAKGVLAWPIDGILTQGYGNTGFTSLGYNFHNGIDVAGPAGTPIYAAADGTVIDDDHSDATFGNWVAIKHNISTPNGSSQIITLYGHMRSFIVNVGQPVRQGDLIGYEGNTGNTTKKLYGPERGYHLHFGVYDAEGFSVAQGAYTKIYGPYKVPYGYTYNPLDFLPPQN